MIFVIVGIFFRLGAIGANVLVEFENAFFNVRGKKLFLDRENQLFWELYGPLLFQSENSY